MRPAIWTAYFLELSPEETVATFAKKGWHELELSDEHARMLLERGAPSTTGANFRCHAAEYGVAFPQGHLSLTCDIAASNQDEVIDGLKPWLDLFVALEIRAAVLHPGGAERMEQGADEEEVMAARVRALSALSDHAAGTELTLCLENIGTAPEAEDLCAIIEATGRPNIGICLDTGHLNLASRDQKGFIQKAQPYLKALHIADNDGSSDQHLLPYGRGTVRWDDVVPSLRQARYAGLFNLEIPGERNCPLPIQLAKLDYAKTLLKLMLD